MNAIWYYTFELLDRKPSEYFKGVSLLIFYIVLTILKWSVHRIDMVA
jgi:hypothetical protein